MTDNKAAVEIKNISKKYTLYHEKPTLAENILNWKKKEEFWALKNISFNVKRGEAVGIVGPNGSGKTTLLEIIAGITTPSAGEIKTFGKLVSLIDLDAGFHPELTGEENIFLNGLLIGMSKTEINSKLKKIIAFADIDKFIDSPMYTYSSGMRLRLGFSIIIHTNPDILVLDETMAVGDQEFKKKSQEKIQQFFKSGKTIIMVSHFLNFLRSNCDRAIWMHRGKIKEDGKIERVISRYKSNSKHYA